MFLASDAVDDEVENDECIHADGQPFGACHGVPFLGKSIELHVFEDRTYHTHLSSSSDESGSDERTAFLAEFIDRSVLRAGADEPADESADEERRI